jgi:hypothetical protein
MYPVIMHRSKVQLNLAMAYAITRASNSSITMLPDGRMLLYIPEYIQKRSRTHFESWKHSTHLALMHAVEFSEGPLINFVQCHVNREPDHYGITVDGLLKTGYFRHDDFNSAVQALGDFVVQAQRDSQAYIISITAVWI